MVSAFIGLLGNARELIEYGLVNNHKPDRSNNSDRGKNREPDPCSTLAIRNPLGPGLSGLAFLAAGALPSFLCPVDRVLGRLLLPSQNVSPPTGTGPVLMIDNVRSDGGIPLPTSVHFEIQAAKRPSIHCNDDGAQGHQRCTDSRGHVDAPRHQHAGGEGNHHKKAFIDGLVPANVDLSASQQDDNTDR